MLSEEVEALDLGPGVDVKGALSARRAAIKRKELEKGIRVVRISKKEISLLEVIDTDRCVRVKIHLQMSWYEPLFVKDGPDLSNPTESISARDENGNFKVAAQVGEIARPAWYPCFRFAEASPLHGEPMITRDDYSLNNLASGQVGCDRDIVVTLDQTWHLGDFPFDRQTLDFQISATTPAEVPFPRVELDNSPRAVPISKNEEWAFREGCMVQFSSLHNTIRVVGGLERNPAHFVWNLASVLVSITAMAAYAFWIDADDLGGRLGLNFTLVLTAVAFKYTVASNLPKIPYLTSMDKLVLGSFASLALCGLEHVVAASLANNKSQDAAATLDNVFLVVVGGIWALLHLAMFVLYSTKLESLRSDWDEKVDRAVLVAKPPAAATASGTGNVV